MAPTLPELATLKATLEQLRDLDGRASFWRRPQYKVFGSHRHRYELLPPLTEAQLSQFETQHQITLPEDYRLFLQHVGNGRVGPSYGLATLTSAVVGDLSRPFLLTRPSNQYSDDEIKAMGFEDEYLGLLQLCHHGCGMYTYLVVNGPTYGTLWFEDGDIQPTGQSFWQWYNEWAQEQLQGLLNEPLVDKIRLGMTREEVTALTGGDWKERVVPASERLPEMRFLNAPNFRAQLKLDENGRVIEIMRRKGS